MYETMTPIKWDELIQEPYDERSQELLKSMTFSLTNMDCVVWCKQVVTNILYEFGYL